MKTCISCRDSVPMLRKWSNRKISETFHVDVTNNSLLYDDEMVIEFHDSFISGWTRCPVRYWAEVKDTVDRLIIKAEHLAKEDC